jgi:hypothetical protein
MVKFIWERSLKYLVSESVAIWNRKLIFFAIKSVFFALQPANFRPSDETRNLKTENMIICLLFRAVAHLRGWWYMCMGQRWDGGQESNTDELRKRPTPVPLHPLWTSHEVTRVWTRNSEAFYSHRDFWVKCSSIHNSWSSLWRIGRMWIALFHFNLLILLTISRTPWRGDQPFASPLPTPTTQTQNKCRQTSMPRAGVEPTTLVFDRAKTVRPRGHCDRLWTSMVYWN